MTTSPRKFVAYYRQFGKVKTSNSLGTQKARVAKFLEENKATLIADYTENEAKSGKTRPSLVAAKRTADAAQKLKKTKKGAKLPIALGDILGFGIDTSKP